MQKPLEVFKHLCWLLQVIAAQMILNAHEHDS